MTLIEARGAKFAYGNAPILMGVDFALREGEFVGLIGPNGSGKSTLLKLLSGLIRPGAGSIDLLGRPLRGYSPRAVARLVAHVPQSTALEFPFTAREIVLMGRSPHLRRFEIESAHDRALADEALRATNALHLADRLINTLSGGEQQRIIIARALAQGPHVLLLDEPTNNLDVKHQLDVLALARTLAHERRLGVVAAVHDLGQAARYCDRLALMVCGRIIADDVPEQVLTPERICQAFEIEARVYRDPFTDALTLSLQ
jgi:iron complex transport system ATP-binding protein